MGAEVEAGWSLAVDFGTSFTTAAVAEGTPQSPGPVEVLEIENSRYLPSLVCLGEDGNLMVGRAAASRAAVFPEYAERLPKRALVSTARTRLGEVEFASVTLVAAVLTKVAAEALRRHNNRPPEIVVLTHPARWGEHELGLLREAADAAGLRDPRFVPEPVAAAVWYATASLPVGSHVAVYDLGGGTFDTAVLRLGADGFHIVGPPGGDPHLGGEDFDEALLEVVRTHASRGNPEAWEALSSGTTPAARRARAQLRRDVTVAKEALSEHPTYTIFPNGFDEGVRVTLGEFQESIEDYLHDSIEALNETIEQAGLTLDQIESIYLTGGASRVPRVSAMLGDELNRLPYVEGDPKAVTVLGALRYAGAAADASRPPAAGPRPGPDAGQDRSARSPSEPTERTRQAARTAASTGLGPAPGSAQPWAAQTGLGAITGLAAHGEAIIVSGAGLAAFDATTGKRQWQCAPLSGATLGPAAIGADGVIYACTPMELVAVDPVDGRLIWRAPLGPGEYVGLPLVLGDVVYVARPPFHVLAVDARTGRHWWTGATPKRISCSADVGAVRKMFFPWLSVSGSWLFAGTASFVQVFDLKSGAQLFHISTGDRNCTAPVVEDGIAYIAGRHHLTAVHLSSGYITAQTREAAARMVRTDYYFSQPLLTDGIVYCGVYGGVVGNRKQDCYPAWASTVFGRMFGPPWQRGDTLYVASWVPGAPGTASVSALPLSSGGTSPQWITGVPSGLSMDAPLILGDLVYIGDAAGTLHAFDADTGRSS